MNIGEHEENTVFTVLDSQTMPYIPLPRQFHTQSHISSRSLLIFHMFSHFYTPFLQFRSLSLLTQWLLLSSIQSHSSTHIITFRPCEFQHHHTTFHNMVTKTISSSQSIFYTCNDTTLLSLHVNFPFIITPRVTLDTFESSL